MPALVTDMLQTTITLLAIVCSASVAVMCVIRWQRSTGFKAGVYLVLACFATVVAILNLSVLVAADQSFLRTATLAYVSFANAILLPAARALGNLTYGRPARSEREDAPV